MPEPSPLPPRRGRCGRGKPGCKPPDIAGRAAFFCRKCRDAGLNAPPSSGGGGADEAHRAAFEQDACPAVKKVRRQKDLEPQSDSIRSEKALWRGAYGNNFSE